ncbi:hypothetical protein BDR22DRAFT_373440 [Usnea florida]
MSGMEAASAGIALAGFVVTTIQQVDKIISTLRNARGDLLGLDKYLEQLRSSLNDAESFSKRLDGRVDQHGSLERIKGAVEYCKKILESLEARLKNIHGSDRSPSKLKNAMISMKYSLKKDDILGIQSQLEYGVSRLSSVILTANANCTYDIYDRITSSSQPLAAQPKPMLLIDTSQSAPSQLIETAGTPLRLVDSSRPVAKANVDSGTKQLLRVEPNVANQRPLSLIESSHSAPNQILEDHKKPSPPVEFSHSASQEDSPDSPSLDARRAFEIVTKQSVARLYNGIFGTVTIHRKSKYVGSSLKIRTVDAKSMSEEIAILLWPAFLRYHYELRSMKSIGRISRTLNVDRVVKNGDPVFRMCLSGDILGLMGAFSGGRASPDMVNQGGKGLLHYAAGNYQLEMCKFLLANGVDVNRTDGWGKKALTYVANNPSHDKDRVDTKTVLTIAELLARKQEELSAFDISNFFQHHHGPPEALELILSVHPSQYDLCSQDDDDTGQMYPMLAAALRHYGRDPSTWEPILRALIRRGAGLHPRVRRNLRGLEESGYPCPLSEYGTPLDELFTNCADREAAKKAADGWLQILASEGCNPSAYLKEEIKIRTKDMHFTCASMTANNYDIPRQLFYVLGDHPSVSWDWWINPASSTFSLRGVMNNQIVTITITQPLFLISSTLV